MPFSSGTYSLPSGNPVVTGTTISSSTTNTTNSDIATALSSCILKDGTQTVTADIPMASHKITGLAAPTTAGDALSYGSALGTPASGVVTNLTGTASININGTVGATTATTGAFTNLAYTGTLTGSTGILNVGSGQVYKDASGNVGIGTSSPAQKLHIASDGYNFRMSNGANSFGYNLGRNTGDGLLYFYGDQSGNTGYVFSGIDGEKMRIDSSGNLLAGTTSALVTPSRIAVVYPGDTTWGIGFKSSYLTGNGQPCTFINSSNAVIGYIGTNGTGTSYITSSDYRLKENVVPITNSLARVMNLKPSRFNFISEADRTVDGFLAHEAQEVVPECVIGTKDALNEDGTPNYQGIDQAKLVPLLTAAIQEQQTLIEALTARLTALEAK